jgi:hypothetical protein
VEWRLSWGLRDAGRQSWCACGWRPWGLIDQAAWVSIERGERDAQRFWLSVIDALTGLETAGELVARLSPTPSFQDEVVVEQLLADLQSLEEPVVLAIDDLHELESADARASLDQGPSHHDLRATALLNLGIAELWSLRLEAVRQDLEQALALARRIRRPYLEIACLAHLGITVPLSREPLPAGVGLAERAIAIAEEHRWTADPVSAMPSCVSCGISPAT